MLCTEFKHFCETERFAEIKSDFISNDERLTDFDCFLLYNIKAEEPNIFDISDVKTVLKNGEKSAILVYADTDLYSELHDIEYKNWGTALKYPELSVYVTSMNGLFCDCPHEHLDLTMFNTSNVANMAEMFANCSNLKNINLSKIDTSNVTSMNCMFLNCYKLETVDLSDMDTSKVKDMSGMFSGCTSLKNLDLSNFATAEVFSMECMFQDCESLTDLNVESFDTSGVELMTNMFSGCCRLKSLDLRNFNINTDITTDMFFDCSKKLNLIADNKLKQIYTDTNR